MATSGPEAAAGVGGCAGAGHGADTGARWWAGTNHMHTCRTYTLCRDGDMEAEDRQVKKMC